MKKGKVFGKSQIAVTVMLLALGAAIWLNMKYSPTAKKYLGEASYVSNTSSDGGVVQTSAKAKDSGDENYFKDMQKERKENREEQQEIIKETLKSDKLTDADKAAAVEKTNEITARMEKESNIETLLKSKGFEESLAVIGDKGVNIVVKADGLTSAQTLQIQDIVTSESGVALADIKIVTVK